MMSSYEPRWPGAVELNLADQWRARWVDEQELPANAPVDRVYSMVCMGDHGFATREPGTTRWEMLDAAAGEGEGEGDPESLIRVVAELQTGVTARRVELIGFFECKATRHNPDCEAGTITVRPFYLVIGKQVADLADGSPFERRRMRMAEYMVAMRARYPEFEEYIGQGALRYAVLRARGEA